MPFLIAAVGALVAVYFFVNRARNAVHMSGDFVDMANDVRLAARRFGFRRRTNVHPVEDIDNANLAIAALTMAFQELDGLPTQDQRDDLRLQLQKHLHMEQASAEEALVLGRWLISQCGGADTAMSRLARKTYKLAGAEVFPPLMEVIKGSLPPSGLSQRQKEALEDLRIAFKITGR